MSSRIRCTLSMFFRHPILNFAFCHQCKAGSTTWMRRIAAVSTMIGREVNMEDWSGLHWEMTNKLKYPTG